MDGGVLPLPFYCRNAHLCLKKAAESRKSNLGEEELQHLKVFSTLVTSSIPTHPQFRGWKDIQEIQPSNLHAHIAEAKQRIKELEDSGHLDWPSPSTNVQKNVTRPSSKPVESLPLTSRSATKSMASPRSKITSEVMLKTSKSVRISEAAPKQRPQRWDVTMSETYGIAKATTAGKPVSLIQRLKRGTVSQPAESKASPMRTPTGKDVTRPLSAQGVPNPTSSGEITPYRGPTPRSRDASRMRGAGPSATPSCRGSTALKSLTSGTVKVRTLDEDCSVLEKPSISNRGMRDSAENGVTIHNNRGSASGPTRPASTSSGKPRFANQSSSGGVWVKGILRNGSDDMMADSNGAMAKPFVDEEELIEWIPSRENVRVSQRSFKEGGYAVESSVSEVRHRGHQQGEFQEEPRRQTPARGVGLREWKGGFVRGDQKIDESHENLDATVVAAQDLMASDGSRTIMENWPASAPVRRAPARVVKGTSLSSGVQPGVEVKEDCEHVRRQMRLLKEKEEDSRMREEEVESMAERLQRRFVDESDVDGGDIWRNNFSQIHFEEEPEELCEVHGGGRSSLTDDQPGSLERTSLESLNRTMTRLMNGDHSDPTTPLEAVARPTLSNMKIKSMAGNASNSDSSTSSQSSLPLSHYIQKLKDSRLKRSANQHQFEVLEHKFGAENEDAELLSMAVSRTDSSERRELSLSASSPGSSPAILLSNNSSDGSFNRSQRPPSQHLSNRLKSQVYSLVHSQKLNKRMMKSDSSSVAMVQTSPHGQHLTTISGSGALVPASHVQDGGKLQDQQALYYPPDESRARALSRSIYESAHQDANDEKISHLQRVLGELKGSMEGVKIRIEVEGEGWRGRVDRLEKELDSVKETDDAIIAAKHSFKDELKTKLSKFMADTEKLLQQEREQVQTMVEERIEKLLKAQPLGSCWSEIKDEMHLLWSEMDSLMKSREDMENHVEHLTFVTKKVQEHSSREQDMLKSENGSLRKQLQSLQDDGIQASSETNREDLRQMVEKLKNDGIDMKMEIQGLRNIEKVLKVELGDLKTRLGKVQDETEELEREKEMTLVEDARERLSIMERVESLSQLYLGGLEEVRQNISTVEFGCSDRVEELESQWNDLKRNQEISCEEGSISLPRQVLLDELDQFRCEIAEMVDIERGLLKERLEEESTSIWRKIMDAYTNNKSEMLNMLKLEIQKQLHSAREKVLLMTDALKRDMDALKTELSHTQDGAENLTQIILAAEGQKEVAAQAATDASSSATKARELLTDMLVSIKSEVTNARQESMQLQGRLASEKDLAIAAASETRIINQEVLKGKEAALAAFQVVRKKSQELQDYLEKESPKLLTAMVVVQKERNTASQAAAEAASSAMKAGEVLAEVLGSFNLEMAKARHIIMQLQEELEHERGLGTQYSQKVQDRISEELEVAIATWKHAMNEEVAKAKEVSEGVDKENPRQLTGSSTPVDLENYISKMEEKLSSLMATMEQLQDPTNNHHDDEKKQLKHHENERKEKEWTANMSQLNQVVRTVEERVNETSSEQTELRKRLKRFEGIQTDLIQSVGEVRSNTCTLEKTVNLFLPQYDAAARIVNEISCKVERLEERIEGFTCDEGLAQVISRVAEAKIESLKELALSTAGLHDLGRDLRDLEERVENNGHSHCQAIAEVETRVAVVECSLTDVQNSGQPEKAEIGTLAESVDALQRKMVTLEQNDALSGDQEPVTGARMIGLESRVEHVASATFNNLQLLDNKVERVSMAVQSALEGAALAENKCGALGAELVKVFRMLTATKAADNSVSAGGNNSWPPLPDDSRHPRRRSHSPPPSRSTTLRLESRSQSPPPRLSGNPAWNAGRNGTSPLRRSGAYSLPRGLKSGSTKKKRSGVRGRNMEEAGNQISDPRKVAESKPRVCPKEPFFGDLEESPSRETSPPIDENWLKSYPRESMPLGRFSGQALTVADDRQRTQPYMAVDRRSKNMQKTNIRLEAGRIHVNVSRRSAAATGGQLEKRRDAIAVQS